VFSQRFTSAAACWPGQCQSLTETLRERVSLGRVGGRLVAAQQCPERSRGFEREAEMKLNQLDAAVVLGDLALPGNHLEAPQGDRKASTAFDKRDTARFWQSQTYFQNRDTLQKAATQYQLNVVETACLFAMGLTAGADGIIGCFDAKYHYLSWRPRHAIWRADTDGKPATEPADTTWAPFVPTPNHPEYPAGHTCNSYAIYDAMYAFFGGDTPITIETINPAGPVSTPVRTYAKFNDIEKEIADARVLGGMHFRHSIMNGAQLGRKVAQNVIRNFFQQLP
jgi:PAP2 superfamily